MMERILLGVLCLSGWVMFSTCILHHYHFVRQSMNWTVAQTYCRETYTDLATTENYEESIQLINTVVSAGYSYSVWIGLTSKIDWRWSDGYTGSGAEYRSWGETEPVYFYNYDPICVFKQRSTQWQSYDCRVMLPFVCNNGTICVQSKSLNFCRRPRDYYSRILRMQQNPEFIFVNQSMTWFGAQKYCRENFKDLATVTTDAQNHDIDSLVLDEYVWIGLFGEAHSSWSDGSNSSYRHWATGRYSTGAKSVMCGFTTSFTSGQWEVRLCETVSPVVCYSIPVQRQIVRLRIRRDSSVDLNDPAVQADLLKKFQESLEEKGGSGFTMKWREHPDGKVFHEEEQS